jgi:hypothetical protein
MRGKACQVKFLERGSLVLIEPQTRRARAWLKRNVKTEPWAWMVGNLVVEPRCSGAIYEGMCEAGFGPEWD